MIEWPTRPSNDSDGMLCYGFDDLLMYTIWSHYNSWQNMIR